jgi:hypothetical protein
MLKEIDIWVQLLYEHVNPVKAVFSNCWYMKSLAWLALGSSVT